MKRKRLAIHVTIKFIKFVFAVLSKEYKMKGKKRKNKDGLTTLERRVKMVKKVANGCWWVEMYLMDRCGISNYWNRTKT